MDIPLVVIVLYVIGMLVLISVVIFGYPPFFQFRQNSKDKSTKQK